MLQHNFTKGLVFSTILSTLSACIPCDPAKLSQVPSLASIPAAYQEDIAFIRDARKFGIENLGLYQCSQHYTWFRADEAEGHVLYILSITKPTILPEYRSAEGKYEFLKLNGFYREDITDFLYLDSEKDTLEDERDYYKNKGFDVYWRSTTNYNNFGNAQESPITPSFLKQSKVYQVQTLFHETCHDGVERWIGVNFSSELNESFCGVIGYAGAAEYFRARRGEQSEEYQQALKSFKRNKDYSEKINFVYQHLQVLYKSPLPLSAKLEIRSRIFEYTKTFPGEEVSNAFLWSEYTYAKYFPLMVQVYEKQGKSVRTILEKMKDCPEKEDDALKFINHLLEK